MIEGGGLGTFAPEQIGPSAVQVGNGVIDILVDDEAAAVAAAKHYLSYFQGATSRVGLRRPARAAPRGAGEPAARVRRARGAARRGRQRLAAGTARRLRRRHRHGAGAHRGPAGRRCWPTTRTHLGGAIDVEAADKAARFMQLCNAHGLPLVALCDTPGFMVGPEIEAQAQVRHVCRMFVVAAHLRVPYFAVVLRKGYGLGAQAMTAGGFDAPVFTVAWPTRRVRRHGPGGRGAAGLSQGAGGRAGGRRSATRCSGSWWRSSTPTAKRSTWRRRWRSTP